MPRQRILSVTAADCRFDVYKSSKKAGGQHKDKTSNCVRCTHVPSGAVGEGEDYREQPRNKKDAFLKMSQTPTFKAWLRNEIAKKQGKPSIEDAVADGLLNNTIVMEEVDGKFVVADRLSICKDDIYDLGLARPPHRHG